MTETCPPAPLSSNPIVVMAPRVRPFLGSLASCAFHVRDEAAFEADAAIDALVHDLDVMRGRRPEDKGPLFCLVRDMEPGKPFQIMRAAGLSLLQDQGPTVARIDDAEGWIAGLQRHLDPACAIVVREYLNPDAPGLDLFWVILPEAAACSLDCRDDGQDRQIRISMEGSRNGGAT